MLPREGLQIVGGTRAHGRAGQNSTRFGALLAAVVDVLVTPFTMRSPVVTILPTVERAHAGGPGAQPGDAGNQSPLCYASPALQQ